MEREVGEYCEARVPAHVRNEIRVEYEIQGNSVTIFECRPPWRDDIGTEWTKAKVPQFRYKDEKWTLYWRDRNGRWFFYERFDPTPNLLAVLEEIDRDPTGIFWG